MDSICGKNHPSFNIKKKLRHQSGSKLRLRESDYKIVDEDGNVLLVLADMQEKYLILLDN